MSNDFNLGGFQNLGPAPLTPRRDKRGYDRNWLEFRQDIENITDLAHVNVVVSIFDLAPRQWEIVSLGEQDGIPADSHLVSVTLVDSWCDHDLSAIGAVVPADERADGITRGLMGAAAYLQAEYMEALCERNGFDLPRFIDASYKVMDAEEIQLYLESRIYMHEVDEQLAAEGDEGNEDIRMMINLVRRHLDAMAEEMITIAELQSVATEVFRNRSKQNDMQQMEETLDKMDDVLSDDAIAKFLSEIGDN